MEVDLGADGVRFAEKSAAFLASDPFTTSVIGGHLSGVLAGLRPQPVGGLWASVADNGRVIGVAMHTPPRNLFLSRMPAAAASTLAETLLEQSYSLPGVNGEVNAVTAFVETWTARSRQAARVEVWTRMYRLGRLVAPTAVPGSGQAAGPDDAEVVRDWFVAFHAEAVAHHPVDDMTLIADRGLLAGELGLWLVDGQPVSLAGVSAAVNGVARVGPVYTPPGHRRRGYGAAVTAYVTQVALDAGASHVVLYTDLANPTSNAIYQAIGYVAHHDGQERHFQDVAATASAGCDADVQAPVGVSPEGSSATGPSGPVGAR